MLFYRVSLHVESLQATVEPHNLTVEITTSVSLSCVVDGFRVSNLSYLWEVTQIREGAEASQLHNATSLHLLLQNVTTSTACRCIVTNSIGTTAVSAFSYITVVGELIVTQKISCCHYN